MNAVCEQPRANDIIRFDIMDCTDKCLRRPWRFAKGIAINSSQNACRTAAVH